MTLHEWRESKGWSKTHLARLLTKKLGFQITSQNIYSWEHSSMPAHDIGVAIDELAENQIEWER